MPTNNVNTNQLQYIYDAYRDAALNRLYYGAKLIRFRQINFWIEIAIAAGATGSSGGIASLAVWGSVPGSYAWLAVSGAATVLAVLKPVLRLAERIENYTKLYAGYTGVFLRLQEIVEEIGTSHSLSEKTREQYVGSRQLLRELAPLVDPERSKRLIRRLQDQVNEDIPPDSLWIPGEE